MIEPIRKLPNNIAIKFRETANYLLSDLENNKFKYKKLPAPDKKHSGHKIRQIAVSNPEWYKEIFDIKSKRESRIGGHLNRNKGQGQIRKRVAKVLLCIIEKTDRYRCSYHSLLRELIKKMLCEGYETNFGEIPPDEEVIKYFEKIKIT